MRSCEGIGKYVAVVVSKLIETDNISFEMAVHASSTGGERSNEKGGVD